MPESRLSLALETGAVALPEEGRIAVFRPRADADLSALPKDRIQIIQGFRPDYDAWAGRGYDCAVSPEGAFAAALVFVPRAKAEARALIAQAVALGGPVWVDGQKHDGIDSLLKECRKHAEVGAPFSKAHGKFFELRAEAIEDWLPSGPRLLPGGFQTVPGVFSADAVDRGSALLAGAFPTKLKGRVADLGAGWGYLAAQALGDHEAITEMHLIEAEHDALECARANIADPRARFHWADATHFQPDHAFDVILCNPPFHTTRSADPAIGVAFMAAAARTLTPSGQLLLVANRHLPYERSLAEMFREVDEIAGDNGFKILRARRPVGPARRGR